MSCNISCNKFASPNKFVIDCSVLLPDNSAAVIIVAVATKGNPPPTKTEHCNNEEIIFTEASAISRCSVDKSNLATPFISTC